MLEILGLRKSFEGASVLAGVDLDIASGELFSLLGPSGCGKSTLLRILAGLEHADAGEVRLDGARLDALPPHQRPCHMVFQRYALFPHLDVRRNVGFALRLQKLPTSEIDRRVDEALALVEMDGYADRRVQQLSGGQQQRVALARAIVGRPRFLLLDEPLSALDLKLRQRMQVELVRLQRRLKITFIFVTHDQEEALTLSDRIAVMHEGHVAQVGTPDQIYRRPESAFVATFIGQANKLEATIVEAAAKGELGAVEVAGLGTLPAVVMKEGARVGERVQVVVRPEHLMVATEHLRELLLPVTVEHVLFKGPHIELLVRPRARPEILLTARAAVSDRVPHAGEPAQLLWPRAEALALADGPS